MNENAAIQNAIEQYQPPWLPQPGKLDDIVVVIDPTGGGTTSSAQRRLDDMALLAGGHLYHLVRNAGGVLIMTRADDRPRQGFEAVCTQHGADLSVTIEFAESGAGVVDVFGDARLSQSLARCLSDVAEVENLTGNSSAEQPSPASQLPAVRVCLSAPSKSASQRDRQVFHRACAERIYRGIAAFVQSHRGELESARSRPGSARAVPFLPDHTWDEDLVRAARRVWPAGDLPTDRAAWFCDTYVRTALSDRSMVYLEPRVSADGDTVVVGGATNIAIMRETLTDALRAVGIAKVRNEMRVLPEDGTLGDQRYGVCIAPMALTFGEPSEAGNLCSQLLYGEPLLLLDRDQGYYLLHGGDGYAGWVREECVRVAPPDEFRRYTSTRQGVLLRDVETDDRRVVQGATLPIGAAASDRVTLMQPEGGTFDVDADDVGIEDNSPAATERINRALALLHRPYVFGGVSPIGLDCSGLMRNVGAQTGLTMARDAFQQFLHGRLVATRWHRDGIRPGDLLYFISKSGKIFHVGIALSRTHFVHSAPPEVQINSFDKGDRLYSEYRDETFFAAKRVP